MPNTGTDNRFRGRYDKAYGQADQLQCLVTERDGASFTLLSGYITIFSGKHATATALTKTACSLNTSSGLLAYTLNVTSTTYPSGQYTVRWEWDTTGGVGQWTPCTVPLIVRGRGRA